MKKDDLSFRNPFEEYNAIDMAPEDVLKYYCEPDPIIENKNADFFRDRSIIFEGSRGCGKTMVLKYLSFDVQRLRAEKEKARFLDFVAKNGGVGFYIRIDHAKLLSFQGHGYPRATWDRLFTHFFELTACAGFLRLLAYVVETREVEESSPGVLKILGELSSLLSLPEAKSPRDLLKSVQNQIHEVDAFRNLLPFRRTDFAPKRAIGPGELSLEVPSLICSSIQKLSQCRLLVVIDEYENFSEAQQRYINGLIRSAGSNVGFRLGMRFEGLKTFGTVRKTEFLKLNSDIIRVNFKDVLTHDKEFRDFLAKLARRRLEATPFFATAGLTDIEALLGHEDDEQEARDLLSKKPNPTRHFEILRDVVGNERFQSTVDLLRCPENPLLEELNILYVLRGKDPKEVAELMRGHLSRHRPPRSGKTPIPPDDTPIDGRVGSYSTDYTNKYKLSLLFLLLGTYKARKAYYGFNIFSFLSSGIPRNFINLCKSSVHRAYYELGPEVFLRDKVIPREIQADSARDAAEDELENIQRIHPYGGELSWLARNLGRLFRSYHLDSRIRYPEANTFTVDRTALSDRSRDLLSAAIMWSVIQRKASYQESGPSLSVSRIFTLNRILCPLFGLSYRTRGGILERFDDSEFRLMCSPRGITPHLLASRKRRSFPPHRVGHEPRKTRTHGKQLTLEQIAGTLRS